MKGAYTLLLRSRLEEAYQKAIDEKHCTYSDMKILRRLKGVKGKTFKISSSKNTEDETCWRKDMDAYLKYAKAELLSFDSKYEPLDIETVNAYLDKGMEDMPSFNLSLGGGVAGVGLSILKASQQ